MDMSNVSADALRAAIENEPRKAELHYLLGAELAGQREYEGAAQEMGRALELDPSLHTCRFQLGLLLLTMALPDQARAVWSALENLEATSPLWYFKRGLEALIEDRFQDCIACLRSGIELNDSNPALNGDMQMIIERVSTILESAPAAAHPKESGEATAVRTDFSLYSSSRD